MVNELPSETQVGAIGWAQDQLYQLKAQVAQLEQRIEQQQLISSTLGETSEQVERSLQAAINRRS
jgi:cell division protein FtsL